MNLGHISLHFILHVAKVIISLCLSSNAVSYVVSWSCMIDLVVCITLAINIFIVIVVIVNKYQHGYLVMLPTTCDLRFLYIVYTQNYAQGLQSWFCVGQKPGNLSNIFHLGH